MYLPILDLTNFYISMDLKETQKLNNEILESFEDRKYQGKSKKGKIRENEFGHRKIFESDPNWDKFRAYFR